MGKDREMTRAGIEPGSPAKQSEPRLGLVLLLSVYLWCSVGVGVDGSSSVSGGPCLSRNSTCALSFLYLKKGSCILLITVHVLNITEHVLSSPC